MYADFVEATDTSTVMAGFGPQGALFPIFGGAHFIFNYLNNTF
jgi:hypothetical protein